MFCTPVSGSRVMTLVAVRVGAESKHGVEALALAFQILAFMHDFVAGGVLYFARRDRVGDGPVPFPLDFAQGSAHAGRIDRAVRGDRADDDRNVVLATASVDDVGEEERLPLRFVHPSDELPAHQRMQLRVLVDRPVDREEEPALLQLLEVLVKIAIAARGFRRERRFAARQVHCFSIFARSTTAFHLTVSDTSSSRMASGELARASTPRSCRRCLTSGTATAALISLFRRSIIARGVFAGAATPFHADAS